MGAVSVRAVTPRGAAYVSLFANATSGKSDVRPHAATRDRATSDETHTQDNKTHVLLYLPNLIGYARIALAFYMYHLANSNPPKAVLAYAASQMLESGAFSDADK